MRKLKGNPLRKQDFYSLLVAQVLTSQSSATAHDPADVSESTVLESFKEHLLCPQGSCQTFAEVFRYSSQRPWALFTVSYLW